MLKELVKQYDDYLILAEDASTLQFTILIKDIKDDVVNRYYTFYEIDHESKTIFLELKQPDSNILIVSNDDLQLPLAIVKNLNEAAEFMRVNATHVYRAYRNAGRPQRLAYNNYILIKNVI